MTHADATRIAIWLLAGVLALIVILDGVIPDRTDDDEGDD